MIIVKLKGGLGNQMFQYALGRKLAEKNDAELKLDISWFSHICECETPRKYGLSYFNIKEIFATEKEIFKLQKDRFIDRFLPCYMKKRVYQKYDYVDDKLLNLSGDRYLEGYWQSEKYFIDIVGIIIKEFTFKKKLDHLFPLKEKIENCTSVSIHIRRGDYTRGREIKSHGVCRSDYFARSIEYIKRKIKEPHFFVFSDDIKCCYNNLIPDIPYYFISEKTTFDYEDLYLMSSCKHNIISNSSFSWWGAWLNRNIDKIVIAPRRWYVDRSRIDRDIVPQTWIKL